MRRLLAAVPISVAGLATFVGATAVLNGSPESSPSVVTPREPEPPVPAGPAGRVIKAEFAVNLQPDPPALSHFDLTWPLEPDPVVQLNRNQLALL